MANLHKLHTIKKKFPQLLQENFGIISSACKKAGIERRTYYNWRNSDQEFTALCDEALERTGDFVESQLLKLIGDGNVSATIFYCKTKLKNRGYTERVEQADRSDVRLSIEQSDKLTESDQKILDRYFYERVSREYPKLNQS